VRTLIQFLKTPLLQTQPRFTLVAVLDILVVAVVIYQFLMIIRGRRAAHILIGVGILTLTYVASVNLGLELLRELLVTLAPYAPIAIIVMFQSELRRLFARLGRRRYITLGGRLQRREYTEDLVLAVLQLAATKTGALIVIERDIGLRTFIESGVLLNAELSRDLLLSIFQKDGALHDGAVIIKGDRIAAAACFLPLSVRPVIAHKLGTRHRAAIGVTEETDCMALVVSEETGAVSAAAFGDLELNISEQRLKECIAGHLSRRVMPSPRAALMPSRSSTVPETLQNQASREANAD
jgi:diadenylate cyclase